MKEVDVMVEKEDANSRDTHGLTLLEAFRLWTNEADGTGTRKHVTVRLDEDE